MAQPLGVVDVLIPGQPSKNRLAQKTRQPMSTILAGTHVGQPISCRIGQAQRVVQFTVSKQSSIGGNRRPTKLEHQATMKIEPQRLVVRFTRRVHRCRSSWPPV